MVTQISIVIPAYNEEEGITKVLGEVVAEVRKLTLDAEIIVVNDGSRDATADMISSFDADEVRLVAHKNNRGYGAALKTGIRAAEHDTIVVIDADCTYPIEYLEAILIEMEEADMVVGARVGDTVEIETVRKPAKWFLRKLASFLAGMDIPDLNSGFRAFKKDLAVSYFHLLPNQFSFTTTITLSMLADSHTITYVPIDYYGRSGSSKIKPTDALHFFILILKTIFFFNPLKILMPLTLLVGAMGIAKLGYDLFVITDIGDSTVFLILLSIQLLGFGLLADLIVRRT